MEERSWTGVAFSKQEGAFDDHLIMFSSDLDVVNCNDHMMICVMLGLGRLSLSRLRQFVVEYQ